MKRGSTILKIAVAMFLAIGTASAEEVTLSVYSSPPESYIGTQIFLKEFVEPLNREGKGIIQMKYIGGPETLDPRKSADALKRGVFDALYGPAGYYAGQVPEAFALSASTVNAEGLRANGGFDVVAQIWSEKVGGRMLAWALSDLGYNLYLTKEPKLLPDRLSLEGMKIRASTGTYRPVIETFGGTPVSMPISELFTSLERGLVEGTGWTTLGMVGSPAEKFVKYRIDPPFFRTNSMLLINNAKWDQLSDKAKQTLLEVAARYEVRSSEVINAVAREESETLKKNGLKTIELEGTALDRYQGESRERLWSLVSDRSEHAGTLRKYLIP